MNRAKLLFKFVGFFLLYVMVVGNAASWWATLASHTSMIFKQHVIGALCTFAIGYYIYYTSDLTGLKIALFGRKHRTRLGMFVDRIRASRTIKT